MSVVYMFVYVCMFIYIIISYSNVLLVFIANTVVIASHKIILNFCIEFLILSINYLGVVFNME